MFDAGGDQKASTGFWEHGLRRPAVCYARRTATMTLAVFLTAGPALADPTFSNFQRNNVNEVIGAEMTLPAAVQAFEVFCTTIAPAEPYRLAILIDPENATYREVDRSDRANPDNPQSWEGAMASIGVGMYFPRIDGVPTETFRVESVHINSGLTRQGEQAWFYWRNKNAYNCFSSGRDGELSHELVQEMKKEALGESFRPTPAKPMTPPPPNISSPAAKPAGPDAASAPPPGFCANLGRMLFPDPVTAKAARMKCGLHD